MFAAKYWRRAEALPHEVNSPRRGESGTRSSRKIPILRHGIFPGRILKSGFANLGGVLYRRKRPAERDDGNPNGSPRRDRVSQLERKRYQVRDSEAKRLNPPPFFFAAA